MTEDEAKTKWCPMARLPQGGYNRLSDGSISDARCVGSDCAVWQQSSYKRGKDNGGYCGLKVMT